MHTCIGTRLRRGGGRGGGGGREDEDMAEGAWRGVMSQREKRILNERWRKKWWRAGLCLRSDWAPRGHLKGEMSHELSPSAHAEKHTLSSSLGHHPAVFSWKMNGSEAWMSGSFDSGAQLVRSSVIGAPCFRLGGESLETGLPPVRLWHPLLCIVAAKLAVCTYNWSRCVVCVYVRVMRTCVCHMASD